MSTISIPLQGGNIADATIEERHIADGAITSRKLRSGFRRYVFTASGVVNGAERRVLTFNLPDDAPDTVLVGFLPTRSFAIYPNSTAVPQRQLVVGNLAISFVMAMTPDTTLNVPAILQSCIVTDDYTAAFRTTGISAEANPFAFGTPMNANMSYADGPGYLFGWYSVGSDYWGLIGSRTTGGKIYIEGAWITDGVLSIAVKSGAPAGSYYALDGQIIVIY